MGGALIGTNVSGRQNAPPNSTLEALYNALNGHTGSEYFVINGYGEALGPSTARLWTPRGADGVAEFVRSGGIWVDYCGWPMYWQNEVGGTQTQLGGSGFDQFVQGIGFTWLDTKQFQTPLFGSVNNVLSLPYALTRGYQESGAQNGVRRGHGTFTTPGGFAGFGGGTWNLNGDGYCALIALHHATLKGWYFYGVYDTTTMYGNPSLPNMVPVDVYAAFVLACLRGQASFSASSGSGTIIHEVYEAPSHTVTANQPGPSSPYPQGTSSGSTSSGSASSGSTASGSTSSGSGGVHVTTTSSGGTSPSTGSGGSTFFAPSSGPPVLEVAGLAAAAGLLTLGGYLLLKK